MSEVPEGTGTRPEQAASPALLRGTYCLAGRGSVRPIPSAVRKILSGNVRRPVCDVRGYESRDSIVFDTKSICCRLATDRETPSGGLIRWVAAVLRFILCSKATIRRGRRRARTAGAKARRSQRDRPVRGGGWAWRVPGWTGTCGGRSPAAGERDCGAVGGVERSPSTGWRETAEVMGAAEGCSHR